MYGLLYLMIVAAVYMLLISSPRCSIRFNRYGVYVGIFYKPNEQAWYLFMIPCIGVRWEP